MPSWKKKVLLMKPIIWLISCPCTDKDICCFSCLRFCRLSSNKSIKRFLWENCSFSCSWFKPLGWLETIYRWRLVSDWGRAPAEQRVCGMWFVTHTPQWDSLEGNRRKLDPAEMVIEESDMERKGGEFMGYIERKRQSESLVLFCYVKTHLY